ncbi:alpha/beta hydrolase [Staphylococcus gallinarum]|uniref:alpha/beta hydrolase n=1 Tax=Staphylococcus gallinarum TaxID=1293 RepID=UPI000D1CC420|nr:alpha/beta hydrolase [Staphylococcus gallinarum]MCD8826590.1 alpha/beta hydrolase [Staphylococcus gallinarum]PTE77855.1 alpha/beta hydrolase [Staphylococcus gallinarum]
MKKLWITILTTLLVVALGIVLLVTFTHKKQDSQATRGSKFANKQVPTLFLHGYAGSVNSEKYMVQRAKAQGVSKNIITATVSRDGDDVVLRGKLSKKAKNPIVQVQFEDNKQGDYAKNAQWLKNVLVKLQHKYHFQHFNFVGHSMGNMTLSQYMLTYGNDKSLPKLDKQVNIAGPFNGVLNMNEKVNEISVDSNGKPSRMNPPYQEFRKLKQVYKGKNIEVLNIYGDLEDGTHSDGSVSISSAKSLKYLLGDSPKSYKEKLFDGDDAQHSQLHENSEVADDLIQFLWGK